MLTLLSVEYKISYVLVCQDSNFCFRSTQSKSVYSAPRLRLWILFDVTVLWLYTASKIWSFGYVNKCLYWQHFMLCCCSYFSNGQWVSTERAYCISYTHSVAKDAEGFFYWLFVIYWKENGSHFHENINICSW